MESILSGLASGIQCVKVAERTLVLTADKHGYDKFADLSSYDMAVFKIRAEVASGGTLYISIASGFGGGLDIMSTRDGGVMENAMLAMRYNGSSSYGKEVWTPALTNTYPGEGYFSLTATGATPEKPATITQTVYGIRLGG